MVFSSPIFVFLFLPLTGLFYFAAPRRARNAVLLLASLVFYAWGEQLFVFVMLASVALNWLFGLMLERYRGPAASRLVIAGAVVVNIGLLAYYKYSGFIAAQYNILRLAGAGDLPSLNFNAPHLPLGISFFTFHALSYVIDIYRRDAKAQRNPIDFALYISFFPQLIAGPIVRYHDICDQLTGRKERFDLAVSGVERIIAGFGKKMILANPLGEAADRIFALPPDQLGWASRGSGLRPIRCRSIWISRAIPTWRSALRGCSASISSKISTIPIARARSRNSGGAGISAVELVPRLSLYPAGRQSRVGMAGLGQSRLHLSGLRLLAWRELDLCRLGRAARLFPGRSGRGLAEPGAAALARVMGLRDGVVTFAWVFFRANDLASACLISPRSPGAAPRGGVSAGEMIDLQLLAFVLGAAVSAGLFTRVTADWRLRADQARGVVPRGSKAAHRRRGPAVLGVLRLAALVAIAVFSSARMASGTYNPFIYFRF